ncbi:MAG: UDP-2,3-diacylglucosamine diphosphatase LpxI [Pseudomonadota bacterium]
MTQAPLGIIAGLGDLPVSIAGQRAARGAPVYILRIAGFEEPRLSAYPGAVVGYGEVGRQIALLKEAGCEDLVFAGIVKRPDFSALKLDFRAVKLMPKVLMAARKGDDALLRVMVGVFEAEGFNVLAAEEANSDLSLDAGLLAGPAPDASAQADAETALGIAREMGWLDIGQGCIVCDGLVLAVEAQEGTDQMLARCAALPEEIRGTSDRPRGVLAKAPKPIQERRIDLPTIGPATLEGAAAAGLAGIALEAGGALILERERVQMLARDLGIFVLAVDPVPDGGRQA